MLNQKEYNKKYYREHREELLEKQRNSPKRKQVQKNWREKNKKKQYKKVGNWRKKNRNKLNLYYKEYYKKNKNKFEEYWDKHKHKIIIRRKTRKAYIKDSECGICGSIKNLEFHHFNYKNAEAFITICNGCHYKIHKKEN